MAIDTFSSFYPAEGVEAPKDRVAGSESGPLLLPPGTEVFSADNHISLSEDIFYERFPEHLKERAPRVWSQDGGFTMGVDGKSFLYQAFMDVTTKYDPRPGASTGGLEARLQDMSAEGVTSELCFPNAVLSLFWYPDLEVKERCFSIYNEYLSELQERSGGRFYGVGLINWWDPAGTRRSLRELKSLGLRTFLLPLKPGLDADGNAVDYGGKAMDRIWDVIEEEEVPICHHIGENPLSTACAFNSHEVGMMHNLSPFRETFGRYVLTGVLDRHKGLRVGWFEGGINWVAAALQDARHIRASFQLMENQKLEHDAQYYWDNHMYASFMVDPLGLELVDRIGINRVMWSLDYPHLESTLGYSREALELVVESVGPEAAARVVGGNVRDFLGLPA